MKSRDRKKYASLMWEARLRIEALHDLVDRRTHVTFLQSTVETKALQLRKVLELIAFASLITYREAYKAVRNDISRDWHAERILKKIEEINPNFYPVPVRGSSQHDWNKLKGGYLTRKQFAALYDKCGDMLHSKSPFNRGKTASSFDRKVPQYIERIENLLTEHLINLASTEEWVYIRVPLPDCEPIFVGHVIKKT